MARPRKKLSKQKQAQRIQSQKKKGSTKDADVETERVSQDLEELKQKQKERRRRLMDEQDDDQDDYEDEDHDGDDCDVSCTNPGCSNYTAAAFAEYDIQSNSVLIKQVIGELPALTLTMVENSLCDLKGVAYPAYEVERADSRDFIVTFYDATEIPKLIEEEAVSIDGHVYPAYVLPTGTNGEFFRDYSSQLLQIRREPLKPMFVNASLDLKCGISAHYRRERSKYEDLQQRIAKRRIFMSESQWW